MIFPVILLLDSWTDFKEEFNALVLDGRDPKSLNFWIPNLAMKNNGYLALSWEPHGHFLTKNLNCREPLINLTRRLDMDERFDL
jgi:hypothetical protein